MRRGNTNPQIDFTYYQALLHAAKMVWRESDGTRRFFLTIENYHPGPDDVTRTRFIVRGETVEEVLDDIVYNTQPSFYKKSENFYKAAHLFYRGPDSCAPKTLTGDADIPEWVENLHLRFRPWASEAGTSEAGTSEADQSGSSTL